MKNMYPLYVLFLLGITLIPAAQAQYIYTIAGNDDFGDGGPAIDCFFKSSGSVFLDKDENIFVIDDHAHVIRKIDKETGIIKTVVGNGENGFSGDGGLAVNASLRGGRCYVDENGNVYIPDAGRIRKVNASDGIIETIAGGNIKDGYLSHQARLDSPEDVFVDKNGDIYFSDLGNGAVRKIDAATGLVETVAGNGGLRFSGDGGLATEASFFHVSNVFVKDGDIYIADQPTQRLLKVDANSGIINTIAGKPGPASSPEDGGLAVNTSIGSIASVFVDDDSNIYFSAGFEQKIRKIDGETSIVETIAGTGLASFSGDGGPAAEATFAEPTDIYVDKTGNMYIADFLNNRIRKIDAQTGVIETIAGNGNSTFSGDGGPALEAGLWLPSSVVVDEAGNIFIADRFNKRIRRVDTQTGIIQTIAGNGDDDFFGDNGPAIEASLSEPADLSVNLSGTIFIADAGNDRIRMITASNTFDAIIASEEATTTNSPTFNITISFNRIAPGFDADDLTLTNATAGEVTSVGNKNFVITITPEEPGLVEVLLEADKVQDLAGNDNLTSNTFSIEYAPEVTRVTRQNLSENLKVYPVPASNEITVELNSTDFSSAAKVTVVNLLGKTVSTTTMTNTATSIPLKDVKPGIYLVKVVLDAYSVSRLITVNK